MTFLTCTKKQFMDKLKAAVIYYSSTGANYQMARWAIEAAEQAGAETRIRKVQELAPEKAIAANPAWKKHTEETKDVAVATLEDLEWADVLIFSAPTRYGNLPAQMKQFLDLTGPLWIEGKLANKVVTGMSSAQNPHGGQEATILSLYTTMYHWGAIVVAPGYTNPVLFSTGGNPYGASTSVDDNGNIKDNIKEAVIHQAKRALTVALWIHNGSRNNESVSNEEYKNQLVQV
jgi:NAD(P)H dehydrogenase (quinone)